MHAVTCRVESPGDLLTVAVLGGGAEGLACLDTSSGALVRAYLAPGAALPERWAPSPFDLLAGRIAADVWDDPMLPDAVVLDWLAPTGGRLHGRRVRRRLDRLAPPAALVPWASGGVVPYWQMRGDRPSLALVPVSAVAVADTERGVMCRFTSPAGQACLAAADAALAGVARSGAGWLAGSGLRRALGFSPRWLAVGWDRPRDGRCRTVVVAAVPDPA